MNPDKIRIGIVGCGGRLQTVLKNLLNTSVASRLEVVALHDPSPLSIQTARESVAPQAEVYPTLEQLLASARVDWIMVGSWNCFHADQIVACLQAGKHIFAEKPLATSLDGCLRIREALEQSPGCEFFFGLVLRYAPLYQRIKQLLEEGFIGDPVSLDFNETLDFNHGGYIHGNWRRHRKNAGTHLLEKCCHDFDIVNWLLGSVPLRVASFGGRDVFSPRNLHLADELLPGAGGRLPYQSWPDPERVHPFSEGASIVDNQVAIMEYASGVRASFHTNCNAAFPERRICLLGTRGAIRADAVAGTLEWRRIGFDEVVQSLQFPASSGHYGADQRMAEGLALTMLGQARPLASLEEALRSNIACLAVDQALDDGRVFDLHDLWEQAGISVARTGSVA